MLPATPPALQQVLLELQSEIETALLNRFELGQQQLRIDVAMTALRVANNELPRLDAVFTGSIQNADTRSGSTRPRVSSKTSTRRTTASSRSASSSSTPFATASRQGDLPSAQLQYLQANDSYRQIIDQVILDVKKAYAGGADDVDGNRPHATGDLRRRGRAAGRPGPRRRRRSPHARVRRLEAASAGTAGPEQAAKRPPPSATTTSPWPAWNGPRARCSSTTTS